MTPAIVVELPATDLASAQAEALLGSCNVGMQERATCVAAPDPTSEPTKLAIAIVSWKSPDHLQARVEVGLRIGPSLRWQARALAFSPGDLETERWRTLGFAIATLVKGALDEPPEEKVAEPPSTALTAATPTILPARETTAAPRDPWSGTSLGAQFVVESGVPRHPPGVGAEVRIDHALGGERWLLEASVGCTTQSLDVDRIEVLRPRGSLGGGVVLLKLGDKVRVVARLALALELVKVSGHDPVSGASDSGDRWVGGLEQGADFRWMWSRSLGAVVGAGVREAAGATAILAHGAEVAHVPTLEWGGSIGIRVAVP